MIPRAGYAQARIQARLADLGDELTWQRLDATRTLGGLLEEARNSRLAHWVSGLSPTDDVHRLEQTLDRRFLDLVWETRSWTPSPWAQALEWTTWLPDLPLLTHLLRDRDAPSWTRGSPRMLSLLEHNSGDLKQALVYAGAGVLAVDPAGDALVSRWLERWRRLWPHCPKRQRARLETLVDLASRHRERFPIQGPDQAWPERQRLQRALLHLFRRSPLEPAAWFAWLGLAALELERLRGALVLRAAFPVGGEG
jgi:hypothetical protein